MARVAFIVTTCHEFEGVKVLSSVLKLHGHQTDCFVTSEERNFHRAVLDWRPDVVAVYASLLGTYRPENVGIYGCLAGVAQTAQV